MHTKMISDGYIRALYMNTKANKTSNRNLTKRMTVVFLCLQTIQQGVRRDICVAHTSVKACLLVRFNAKIRGTGVKDLPVLQTVN